jgi:FkbM family methyltransferase
MDRLKPWLRAIGYATPLQRELRRRLRDRTMIRAIQIGAHDGVTHDPFREHLILPGWTSLVLEPHPGVFSTLVKNYRAYPQVTAINAAIAYDAPHLTLWMPDPAYLAGRQDAAALSTMASHSRELLVRNLGPHSEVATHLQSLDVPCLTLEALLDRHHWPGADVLFVDVEGFENEILLRADLDRLDASLIVYEHHLLNDFGAAINERLGRHGYACLQVGGDTIAER